jgi:hypothetical protein
MLAAGLPELSSFEHVSYMIDKFNLDSCEKKAESTLCKELERSLRSTSRCIDNLIHNVKHGRM